MKEVKGSIADTSMQNRGARPPVDTYRFQHQIHHRGQAHAMLLETTVKPPQHRRILRRRRSPLEAAANSNAQAGLGAKPAVSSSG